MKKIFLLTLFGILLLNLASATSFVNIYVDSSGSSVFFGETNESSLDLPEGVSINSQNDIRGRSNSLTSKSEDLWTFSYLLQDSELNIILPTGSIIKSLSPGVQISLEGERISLFSQDFITVTYEIEPQDNFFPSSNIPLIIILGAVLFVLIIYLVNYSNRDSKKPKLEKQNIDNVQNLLNEREKIILKKLKETGKIKSSQLRKETEIPKASFSRHVQELEKKKLIKRSGEGKNKFVELVE